MKDELVLRERQRERGGWWKTERGGERDRERERRGKSTFQVGKKRLMLTMCGLGAAHSSGRKNGAKGKAIKKRILIRK
jgi:hypothetical protein